MENPLMPISFSDSSSWIPAARGRSSAVGVAWMNSWVRLVAGGGFQRMGMRTFMRGRSQASRAHLVIAVSPRSPDRGSSS